MRYMNRILLVLCILSGQALAKEPILDIEDLDFDKIRSPIFPTESHRYAYETREDWFQFSLEYDVGGQGVWLNRVEVEWHVMLDSSQGSVLLGKKIRYADVPEGTHYAVVYLRPNFIKRYGKQEEIDKRDLRVLIIVRIDGKEVQRHHYPSRISESEWWSVNNTSTSTIIKRDELLARTETPFAPLDWDFYQYIESYAPSHPPRKSTPKNQEKKHDDSGEN
ncbi:MAG: hypothetical protein PF904_03965 [Kiritimatiellae bacterium]|jgi:hypothetical protein|nr:hypothetical protein [Kiritimatiellia bacterium]